jgi:hypothetical protein
VNGLEEVGECQRGRLRGSPNSRRALPGSRTSAVTAPPRQNAADDLAADPAGGTDHCDGHRVSFR